MTENYYKVTQKNNNIYISSNMPLYLLIQYLIELFETDEFNLSKISYKEYCKNVSKYDNFVYRNIYI